MILKESFKVELKNTGKENFIKNIGILEILENIATHHSDLAGYGPNDIKNTGVSWVLLDWKLKVKKRPQYGEVLNVNTWARLTDTRKKLTCTYRDFEIYNTQNELCAIATSKWVLIDIETGRIKRIDENLIGKYNPEYKSVFNKEELGKIIEQQEFTSEIECNVNRKDIDINGHMHNLNYLDFAYEALPEDVYKNCFFDNVRIQYKHEIKLGNIVKCKYTFKEDKHIITITNKENTIVYAIVVLSF